MYSSKVYAAFVIVILVPNVRLWNYECPDFEQKCRCTYSGGKPTNDVQCRGIDSNGLQTVIEKAQWHIFGTFQLVRSRINYISDELFSKISMERLEIILCIIYSFPISQELTPNNNFKALYFEDTTVKKWEYGADNENKNLNTFQFTMIGCPETTENHFILIQKLPINLISITVHLCPLESNGYPFLQRFKILQKFEMVGNELSYFDRSYLPKPAKDLRYYSLSQNPIKSIQEDAFAQMPALREVYLEYTSLVILPYDIFKPLITQLDSLQVAHNPLDCGCENAWIHEYEDWIGDIPKCEMPTHYKNKRITDINLNELCPLTITSYFDTLVEFCNTTINPCRD